MKADEQRMLIDDPVGFRMERYLPRVLGEFAERGSTRSYMAFLESAVAGAIADALRDLDEARVNHLVGDMLERGIPLVEIIGECNAGTIAVGELFTANQYFLTELMFSAEIVKGVMKRLERLLESSDQGGAGRPSAGTVAIGTVEAVAKAALRDQVKTIVGGAIRNERVREFTGADFFANDAMAGINLCEQVYS